MDLMQEDPNNDNKVKSLKKSLILIVVFAFILIIVAIVIYVYSIRVARIQRKVLIDGTNNSALANNSEAFIIDEQSGNLYLSIKTISPIIGYTFYPGEYQQYTEDKTNCYVTNQKELVTFTTGSKEIRKYPQLTKSESQLFELSEPVQNRANNLYISQKDMERAFNTVVKYTKDDNTISIKTLPYIASTVSSQIENAYVISKENETTTSEITEGIMFNNQKALLSNLVVIQDENTKLFGVAKSDNSNLDRIISEKYKTVEFIEGANDFIVKTEDGKYGIIGNEGIPKIKPDYDQIEELDKDLGLYLVTNNGKQRVVNSNGNVIVYQEYDQIGLDRENGDKNVKNRYLLYNNCIPVKVDKKWGLIDKDGNKILNPEYDGIGCKLSSTQANTTGIVLIPDLEGIVVEQDIKVDDGIKTIKKYGLISSKGEKITDVVADSAYAMTIDNKVTYYLAINNQMIDIVNFWNQWKYGSTNQTVYNQDQNNSNQQDQNQQSSDQQQQLEQQQLQQQQLEQQQLQQQQLEQQQLQQQQLEQQQLQQQQLEQQQLQQQQLEQQQLQQQQLVQYQ